MITPANIEAPAIPAVNRKFWAILGLSVLLHGSLLALTSWERKNGPVSLPPLLASIRLIAVTESGPVAEPAPAPAAVPQKARQETRRRERMVPPATQTAGPANVPANAPSPSSALAAESVAPAAEASAPVSAPVAEIARPAPAIAPQRPQSEVLAGYRQRLGELFARHQEYPRVAAMRGWEGEVRLRLKVARKGNLLGVVLDRSSGFDVLDQHALAMLEALAGLPPLPEALEANEIQVVVPINYKLKKTT
ncbi:MAG: TonB family protein [Gammaproteobacteria bacterium]|nr:TonB family protein [Gammaproteobacteria bacterium]MBU1603315.1 TonB family protein [Gammaproteobacteria bacterium]MBU2432835.1 TonB family protein [Gammaproteobacteria bacterium]MBU2450078.1 TonB family protein [Gammaproteobacteria bacterium]